MTVKLIIWLKEHGLERSVPLLRRTNCRPLLYLGDLSGYAHSWSNFQCVPDAADVQQYQRQQFSTKEIIRDNSRWFQKLTGPYAICYYGPFHIHGIVHMAHLPIQVTNYHTKGKELTKKTDTQMNAQNRNRSRTNREQRTRKQQRQRTMRSDKSIAVTTGYTGCRGMSDQTPS